LRGARRSQLSNRGSVDAAGAQTSPPPARAAFADVLAAGAIPAGEQARGADALVAEQAPWRGLSSVPGWTRRSSQARQLLCSDAALPRAVRIRASCDAAAPASRIVPSHEPAVRRHASSSSGPAAAPSRSPTWPRSGGDLSECECRRRSPGPFRAAALASGPGWERSSRDGRADDCFSRMGVVKIGRRRRAQPWHTHSAVDRELTIANTGEQ
jgi:hypothetical protein